MTATAHWHPKLNGSPLPCTQVYASLHFGGEYPDHAMVSAMHHAVSPISDGFHVYAVEWSREQLKW